MLLKAEIHRNTLNPKHVKTEYELIGTVYVKNTADLEVILSGIQVQLDHIKLSFCPVALADRNCKLTNS